VLDELLFGAVRLFAKLIEPVGMAECVEEVRRIDVAKRTVALTKKECDDGRCDRSMASRGASGHTRAAQRATTDGMGRA